MSPLLLVIVLAAVILAGALLSTGVGELLRALLARRAARATSRAMRPVMVNLHSGRAFSGVLWAEDDRYIVLRGARLLEPGTGTRGGPEAPIDGEVLLGRGEIEFVQVLS